MVHKSERVDALQRNIKLFQNFAAYRLLRRFSRLHTSAGRPVEHKSAHRIVQFRHQKAPVLAQKNTKGRVADFLLDTALCRQRQKTLPARRPFGEQRQTDQEGDQCAANDNHDLLKFGLAAIE